MSATPPYDPSVAIQEMQKLDDIEADLADTALAVAAIDEDDAAAADAPPRPDPEPWVEPEASAGAGAGAGDEALIQNAEAIEQVLEQAIPDAPEHDTAQEASQSAAPAAAATSNGTAAAASQSPDPSHPTPTPTPSSAVAEVQEAVQAVAADVNVAILPEAVVAPAHSGEDIDMEQETVSAGVTTSQPDALSVPPPSSSMDANSPSSHPVQIPSGAGLPPRPDVVAPGTTIGLPPVNQETQLPPLDQTDYIQTTEEAKPLVDIDIDLPEGLDSGSASIRSNPDLVRAWARGE